MSTGPCETIEKPAKKNSKKKAKRDTAVNKGIINEQRRRVIELKFSFFFYKIECPTVCTAFHAPICGDNGKTYSNKCQLDVESCQSGKKIKIVSTGNCPSNKTRRATKPGIINQFIINSFVQLIAINEILNDRMPNHLLPI